MPPKAKAKARVRRPAAAPPVLRRPAARVRRVQEVANPLNSVPSADLLKLGLIKLPNAVYYQREVEIVGEIQSLKLEGREAYAEMVVQGTQDEEILRTLTGKTRRVLWVHLCSPSCQSIITGEDVVHGKDFVKVKAEDQGWYSNLVQVGAVETQAEDQLEKLRAEQERLEEERTKGEEKSPKEKKKKEKKEKKEKKRKEEGKKKRKEKKEKDSGEKAKKVEESSSSEELERGQKNLSALFSGTGLDPNVKRRHKVVKKARRLGRAKKKKKKKEDDDSKEDSSTYSSGTTSGGDEGTGLFETGRKVCLIAERCPGALTSTSLGEAKQCLLMASGNMWQMDKHALPPLYTHYVRQQLAPVITPVFLEESLTVAAAIDSLLLGKPAHTCDLLSQRLKSLESLARGSHWKVGRQHELIRTDFSGMVEEAESLEAAKKAKEEEKLKSLTQRPNGGGNSEGSGKGQPGKNWKGSQKGKQQDAGKGKGDGKRGDKQQPWQKDKEKS